MSDRIERRCDGCAYWQDTLAHRLPRQTEPGGFCHHSTATLNAEGFAVPRPADWWCSEFWPATVPLPEPWKATYVVPAGD